MQFKPVIFVILGISLMSLAVTNALQQQAMGIPKFDNSELGNLCKQIYDFKEEMWDIFMDPSSPREDAIQAGELYDQATALYDKYCADKFGTAIPSDLKNYLDSLPDVSKVTPKGLMDLLQDLKNTARNIADDTNVPEDGGVTKKR